MRKLSVNVFLTAPPKWCKSRNENIKTIEEINKTNKRLLENNNIADKPSQNDQEKKISEKHKFNIEDITHLTDVKVMTRMY